MLNTTQLRKLIRAHNKLSKIVIPKGSKRDDLIKLIEKAGYKVDHENKVIIPKVEARKKITLKQAEEITKPKPKTALQKQKASERKAEKEAEQKKKERAIRKKAVEEEKVRQKKKESPPKKKTISTQTSTPKQNEKDKTYQVKDDEIRFDFYDDKTNSTYKRFVYQSKDAYEKLLKLIKDKGYTPTKKQEELLKDGLIDYVSNKKSLKGVDIKRGKGKTDMIIISVKGHEFGSGIGSIRIKKK